MRASVLTATASDEGLNSPIVGYWSPAISVSDAVEAGALLGRIRQAGTWREIRVPGGVGGLVKEVLSAQGRVECGSLIVKLVLADDSEAVVEMEARPPAGVEAVNAPMAGLLYRQSAPGKPPYAAEGELVTRNQTIGLIEVMKTLMPVRATLEGRLEKWLLEDGEPVHQGQAIAWLTVEGE